ncbi:MAG: AAA domain-containing protein [Bacteroidota bacterium]
MLNSTEKLDQLRKLVKIERDEDFKIYQDQFLRSNIDQRKKHGYTWYPIVINSTEIGFGDYLIIEIERTNNLSEPHHFNGGKNVSFFSNAYPDETPLNGTIKSLNKNKMKISLTVDELPDWADDGKLGINLQFDENSYKEMDNALQEVIKAKHTRLAEIRDIIYEGNAPEYSKEKIHFENSKLNTSQQQALEKIVSAKDIAIVHGPPGTGKTTTFIEAIIETLKTEKQVLVCSPSNTAVDVLTEKLAQRNVNVIRIGNPARVSENLLNSTLDAKIMAHEMYKDLKNYRKNAEEFFRMASKYKRNFGFRERQQKQLLYLEARKILGEAKLLEDYILYEQLDKAQVITCTLVGANNRYLKKKHFETVFIDEAAQALEPATWIPISKANRVIMAGDHHQLAPTVKSKNAEAAGLAVTLFEKAVDIPNVSVMLTTQYRMHQDIMQFSNQQFYEGNLVADIKNKMHVLNSDSDNTLLNTPVEFIDTAGSGYNETLNHETMSVSNRDEALILVKHLNLVLQGYIKHNADYNKLSIGIISPYKEQIILLDEILKENIFDKDFLQNIKIKTIDGFQGQERDIIYISMVRSNDKNEIGFLSDTRRMNVALTRAKKKLVVIGDSATLGSHPFYEKFLNYIEKINAYKSVWEYISLET